MRVRAVERGNRPHCVRIASAKWLAVPVAFVFLLSCSLSLRRIDLLSKPVEQGSYRKGIQKVRGNKELYGNLNRLLYFLDQGLLFHYAGEYDSSLAALRQAETVIDELYARSITNEAVSLVTNDLLRPYRPRRYERILLHQFMALDYLARNEPDEALVESRKIQLVIDSYASRYRGEERHHDDGMSHYVSSIVYEAQGERDNSLISLFKSVAAYRDGPVALPPTVRDRAYHRLKRGDREEDIARLGLEPEGPLERVTRLDSAASEIVLIGYAGKAPVLKQTVFRGTYIVGGLITGTYHTAEGKVERVAMPAPPLPRRELEKIKEGKETDAGTTFHVSFALPDVVARPSRTAGFDVAIDDREDSYPTATINDTETLLRRDVADNRPVTLGRTAIRVVLRTLAAQRAKKKVKTSSPVANLVINVGADIMTDQLERADTRSCFLFPRTFQIARIPVHPGVHRVTAHALDTHGVAIGSKEWEQITVEPGQKRFIFYASLN